MVGYQNYKWTEEDKKIAQNLANRISYQNIPQITIYGQMLQEMTNSLTKSADQAIANANLQKEKQNIATNLDGLKKAYRAKANKSNGWLKSIRANHAIEKYTDDLEKCLEQLNGGLVACEQTKKSLIGVHKKMCIYVLAGESKLSAHGGNKELEYRVDSLKQSINIAEVSVGILEVFNINTENILKGLQSNLINLQSAANCLSSTGGAIL
jgi:hypothetical protein